MNPEKSKGTIGRRVAGLWVLAAATVLAVSGCQPGSGAGSRAPEVGAHADRPGHVFVINLENQGFDTAWGADSDAPYLSETLRSKGVLLTKYYAIAHHSTPNYIAQISGQASNPMTRNDCGTYIPFVPAGTAQPGQVKGTGCIYPASVPTVAGQLSAAGKTWKGYMEGMKSPCRHPEAGADDENQDASPDDEYATRHNPFVYFAAITSSPDCQKNVVDFTEFAGDLSPQRPPPTFPTSAPTYAMTGMTVRARTAGREAWSAPTSGCRNRYPRFWTPRPISRTGCWSLPLTKLTVPSKAQRAFPEEQPGAASAPWCSPPSSRAARHRTRHTPTTAFWPRSKTFSRCHASPMPVRPELTVLDPTSSTRGRDQPAPRRRTT